MDHNGAVAPTVGAAVQERGRRWSVDRDGVDLTRKDSRGLTPLQTALGQAGGFGFGGTAGVVREETAKVLAELTGVSLAEAKVRAGQAAAAAPQGSRAQDDDPNN